MLYRCIRSSFDHASRDGRWCRGGKSTGITGDIILLLSLFVLGGNFWDKLRALFIRDAKVAFPEKAAAP